MIVDKLTGEVLLTEEDLLQEDQEQDYSWEDVMYTLFPNACCEEDLEYELDTIWND